MFRNHVHTRHIRRMLTTAAVLPLFAVAACSSGDDGDPGGLDVLDDSTSAATSPSTTIGGATSTPEGTSGEGSAPGATACTPEQADAVGEGFDKAACVSLGADLVSPTLVDDTVWAWVDNDHVAAYDAATGAEVFRADKPKGAIGIDSIAAIEVDGEQMVAAMVAVTDPGDAVNAPSEGWQLLAWPADAAEAGSPEPAIDAFVEVTEGNADPTNSDAFWGNRGVMIDLWYLAYDATEFATYKLPLEYKLPNSEDPTPPEPYYVGTSQDVALGYIEAVDVDARNVAGFFAVDASGEELWNHLSVTPGADDVFVGYEGPTHVEAVWGAYALDITMAESGDGGEVNWYDAATGEEATPTPDELAGANIRGFDNVVITPDGTYLAFSAAEADSDVTRTFILDVASGAITRVNSENELRAESMIGTTLYATSLGAAGGGAVVDVTTGEATPMESGTAPIAVSESFGLFFSDTAFAAPRS